MPDPNFVTIVGALATVAAAWLAFMGVKRGAKVDAQTENQRIQLEWAQTFQESEAKCRQEIREIREDARVRSERHRAELADLRETHAVDVAEERRWCDEQLEHMRQAMRDHGITIPPQDGRPA